MYTSEGDEAPIVVKRIGEALEELERRSDMSSDIDDSVFKKFEDDSELCTVESDGLAKRFRRALCFE